MGVDLRGKGKNLREKSDGRKVSVKALLPLRD